MLAAVAAAAAAVSAGPVFEPLLGGAPCWRIPSLVATSSSTLLAFAGSRCKPGDGCQPIGFNKSTASHSYVGLRRSTDGGETWGPLQTLYSAPCDGGYPGSVVLQPNGVYDPHKKLVHVMFMAANKSSLLVYSSGDEGKTWTQRAPAVTWPHDTAPGNGAVMSSGRILLFGQGSKYSGGAYAVGSDDGGQTFSVLGEVTEQAAMTLEPQAVELTDGSLYLKGHTGNFSPRGGLVSYAQRSTDGGATWAPLALQPAFNLTTCAGGLTSVRPMWGADKAPTSPVLYFSHPNVPAALSHGAEKRYNGTVWRSRDSGVSWTPIVGVTGSTEEPQNMFAYSVMTPVGEPGAKTVSVGMLFEGGDAGKCADDPRYRAPSQSCVIVYRKLDLEL